MKICITAQGNTLKDAVDPRFGRCQYFIIVDSDTEEFEAFKNPNIDSSGGAGIQSGQLIAEKNAQAVLTGNIGPNAFKTLHAAGVNIFTGVTGTIKEAINKYKNDEYKTTNGPSVDSHFGSGKA